MPHAAAVSKVTCLHLIRKKKKKVYGGNYGGNSLALKLTTKNTLRFLHNQILISRDNGLLLIQADQLRKATEIFVLSKQDLVVCKKDIKEIPD